MIITKCFSLTEAKKMQSFSKSCLLHITQTEQITAQNSLFNTGGLLGWILTLHTTARILVSWYYDLRIWKCCFAALICLTFFTPFGRGLFWFDESIWLLRVSTIFTHLDFRFGLYLATILFFMIGLFNYSCH